MRARGFTLLEVLIAASLLSIMMLLLLGSLRIGASSWENGEKDLERTSQFLVVQAFLRKHLSVAIPRPIGDPLRLGAQFIGTRSTLEYVGLLPAQIRPGLYRFSFFLEARGGQKSLKLGVKTLDATAEGEQLEELPAFPVTPLDTTAAGDAFIGAFAVALLEGKGTVAAARWANAAGALATTKAGAQPSLPRRSELEAFLEQMGAG